VDGFVRDASGAVVANATVNLQCGSSHLTNKTDNDGRFAFSHVPGTTGTLEVSAQGFTVARQSWKVEADQTAHLEFTLQPPSAREQVTVSDSSGGVQDRLTGKAPISLQ
jgi:Carboxypeptidase regulatory-like domain